MGYGGDVTVTNLTRGSANVITGSMRCDYAYYGVTAEGIPVKQIGYETVTFESLIVYTHPGPFNIGASAVSSSSNNIIANVLTADKINNEWIPHFQKAYHWKKQHQSGYINGTDYNPAKNYYSPNP